MCRRWVVDASAWHNWSLSITSTELSCPGKSMKKINAGDTLSRYICRLLNTCLIASGFSVDTRSAKYTKLIWAAWCLQQDAPTRLTTSCLRVKFKRGGKVKDGCTHIHIYNLKQNVNISIQTYMEWIDGVYLNTPSCYCSIFLYFGALLLPASYAHDVLHVFLVFPDLR